MEMENSYYKYITVYVFITIISILIYNITIIYIIIIYITIIYRYYRTFLKDFIESGPRPPKKAPGKIIIEETWKNGPIYYTNITDITEYYGP